MRYQMEQFFEWVRALIMPAFALGTLVYMYHKDEKFFGEDRLTPNQCDCGCEHYVYRGVQETEHEFDLDLFNCTNCGTTRAVKAPKRAW